MNCRECIDVTQRMCQRCGGGYCLIHNEGSDLIACEWCVGRTRLMLRGDLY
ncbi:hypothetical protein N656DRAFT_798114 [Canariomyces notabilis]|uniref:Uncharacterized protein n=1 Tax=Canariomyces notabilis TaxID=2074819 RepID=A0AAN6TEH1_9PEZI|nr:hypothetical protein N656DRAFT_798114 [Canariomyces arenarius]